MRVQSHDKHNGRIGLCNNTIRLPKGHHSLIHNMRSVSVKNWKQSNDACYYATNILQKLNYLYHLLGKRFKKFYWLFVCRKTTEKGIAYQLTVSSVFGFASYEQDRKMSVLSFTVTFSGLTDTMGGSETQTNFQRINLSKISDRGILL
jgi:hypothetical protein